MEMSVGFADKEKDEAYYRAKGFRVEKSPVGKVFYPKRGVILTGAIAVRYEEKPWLSAFEIDGIRAKQPKRGKDHTKNMQMILQFTRAFGKIARRDVTELCRLTPSQASELLRRIVKGGYLQQEGRGCATHYLLTEEGRKYR